MFSLEIVDDGEIIRVMTCEDKDLLKTVVSKIRKNQCKIIDLVDGFQVYPKEKGERKR